MVKEKKKKGQSFEGKYRLNYCCICNHGSQQLLISPSSASNYCGCFFKKVIVLLQCPVGHETSRKWIVDVLFKRRVSAKKKEKKKKKMADKHALITLSMPNDSQYEHEELNNVQIKVESSKDVFLW